MVQKCETPNVDGVAAGSPLGVALSGCICYLGGVACQQSWHTPGKTVVYQWVRTDADSVILGQAALIPRSLEW
jgi:hypothetical protein